MSGALDGGQKRDFHDMKDFLFEDAFSDVMTEKGKQLLDYLNGHSYCKSIDMDGIGFSSMLYYCETSFCHDDGNEIFVHSYEPA